MCGTGHTHFDHNFKYSPILDWGLRGTPLNRRLMGTLGLPSIMVQPPPCACNGLPGPFIHADGCTSVFNNAGVQHHALANQSDVNKMNYDLEKERLETEKKFGWFDRIAGLFTSGAGSNIIGAAGSLVGGLFGSATSGIGGLIGSIASLF